MSAYLYRRLAAECLRRASSAIDQDARSALGRMAIASADLAEQAERNRKNDANTAYRIASSSERDRIGRIRKAVHFAKVA
jgi:hypothetical protein